MVLRLPEREFTVVVSATSHPERLAIRDIVSAVRPERVAIFNVF